MILRSEILLGMGKGGGWGGITCPFLPGFPFPSDPGRRLGAQDHLFVERGSERKCFIYIDRAGEELNL